MGGIFEPGGNVHLPVLGFELGVCRNTRSEVLSGGIQTLDCAMIVDPGASCEAAFFCRVAIWGGPTDS